MAVSFLVFHIIGGSQERKSVEPREWISFHFFYNPAAVKKKEKVETAAVKKGIANQYYSVGCDAVIPIK